MALDAWLAATVPAHYTRRTLEAMRGKLADQSEEQEASASPSRRSLQPVGEMLDRASGAVVASDHAAAGLALEEIRRSVEAIRSEQRMARRP
jgi:hypothetical protein